MARELPEQTQLKLRRLIEMEQQASHSISATMKEIAEINRLLVHSPGEQREADLKRELAFQQNSLSRYQIKNKELSTLNNYLRQFLERLPAGCEIVRAKNVEVKFLPKEDNLTAVDRIRGEITALLSEKSKIERAEMSLAEKKTLVTKIVKDQARRGAPYVRFENGEALIKWEARVEGAYTPTPDIGAMLAFLYPKTVTERLYELLERAPQPALSMSNHEKVEVLKEIERKLLACERREEQLIVAADERNQQIARRPQADPRAVMQIIVRSPAQVVAKIKKHATA